METLKRSLSGVLALPYPILSLAMFLAGCEAIRPSPQPQAQPQPGVAEHGYALLFDLVGDEKDVSKLRFIKHERPELKVLVNEISRTCGEAHKALEAFGKA